MPHTRKPAPTLAQIDAQKLSPSALPTSSSPVSLSISTAPSLRTHPVSVICEVHQPVAVVDLLLHHEQHHKSQEARYLYSRISRQPVHVKRDITLAARHEPPKLQLHTIHTIHIF